MGRTESSQCHRKRGRPSTKAAASCRLNDKASTIFGFRAIAFVGISCALSFRSPFVFANSPIQTNITGKWKALGDSIQTNLTKTQAVVRHAAETRRLAQTNLTQPLAVRGAIQTNLTGLQSVGDFSETNITGNQSAVGDVPLGSGSGSGSSDEPEIDYLYENNFPPVVEFMKTEFNDTEGVDAAVMAYLAGADKNGTAERRAKFEKEMRHPDFLYAEDQGDRVVEFYAPWCPHCQAFKSHYVELAKEVIEAKGAVTVKFYAVSCTVHKPICRDFDIHSYPRVLLLKAGSTNGDVYRKSEIDEEVIFEAFGIEAVGNEGEEGGTKKEKGSTQEVETDNRERIPRKKEDIYRDAALSFDFALRNAIYTGRGPLTKETSRYLEDWLDIMRKTMPMEMSLTHKQIGVLTLDFPDVVVSEDNLNKAINGLRPKKKTWSKSCTHGKMIGGYTCGLWEMFHIMTMGIVEWNIVSPPSLRVSTNHAAESMRGYVKHFFGCEVCRENFIKAYDSCARDRCVRLHDETDTATVSDWKQLPLWLWETHNEVNVRLLKEKAEQWDDLPPTAEEQQAVRWPSKDACPRCWNDDWTWNEEVVYSFLRLEYWPDDDKTDTHRKMMQLGPESDEDSNFKWEDHLEEPSNKLGMIFVAPFGLISAYGLWWMHQKREKDRTGRHKKFDSSNHGCPRNGITPSGQDTYFSHRV